jgi:hypothetical protein
MTVQSGDTKIRGKIPRYVQMTGQWEKKAQTNKSLEGHVHFINLYFTVTA